MKTTTRRSISILITAAIICLGSAPTVPIGPVPLSFQNMLVIIASCTLGGLNGTGATGIFILIGTLGLPVFSNFSGGISHLIGPTGGFIAGYFISSIVPGIIAGTPFTFERKFNWRNYGRIALAALIGYALIYVPGIPWFMHVMSERGTTYSFKNALSICLMPFIPFDIAKLAITIPVSTFLRPVIAKKLYPPEEDAAFFDNLKQKKGKRTNKSK